MARDSDLTVRTGGTRLELDVNDQRLNPADIPKDLYPNTDLSQWSRIYHSTDLSQYSADLSQYSADLSQRSRDLSQYRFIPKDLYPSTNLSQRRSTHKDLYPNAKLSQYNIELSQHSRHLSQQDPRIPCATRVVMTMLVLILQFRYTEVEVLVVRIGIFRCK